MLLLQVTVSPAVRPSTVKVASPSCLSSWVTFLAFLYAPEAADTAIFFSTGTTGLSLVTVTLAKAVVTSGHPEALSITCTVYSPFVRPSTVTVTLPS